MTAKVDKKKFSEIFADQLNRLNLAYEVLAAGLENSYGGKMEFDLSHSNSAWVWANLHVTAECELRWGNGWSDWSASGQIEWSTSSDHYVMFEFSREQDGEIELNKVVIGDDDSESFYPWIREVCESNEIPLEVREGESEAELVAA